MLAGHYSAAFLAKALEPRLPLWILAIAVQLVDVLWAVFVLAGIEHLRVDPSLPSNPLDLYDMPYTHSLLGALAWAALAAGGGLRLAARVARVAGGGGRGRLALAPRLGRAPARSAALERIGEARARALELPGRRDRRRVAAPDRERLDPAAQPRRGSPPAPGRGRDRVGAARGAGRPHASGRRRSARSAVAGSVLVLFAAVAWGAWRAERRAGVAGARESGLSLSGCPARARWCGPRGRRSAPPRRTGAGRSRESGASTRSEVLNPELARM